MILQRILYAALGVLICIDIGMYGYTVYANSQSPVILERYVRTSQAIQQGDRPTGYPFEGALLPAVHMKPTGWAVRYTSITCEYCRADEVQWNGLKSRLIMHGYHIYYISPDGTQPYPGRAVQQPSETQLSFIPIDWMKQYRLDGTPTTLLFDSQGKLLWGHVGTMTDNDQQAALKNVAKSKK